MIEVDSSTNTGSHNTEDFIGIQGFDRKSVSDETSSVKKRKRINVPLQEKKNTRRRDKEMN